MPLKIQEELKMIVEKLKEEKSVKEIYLFGSYAYGTPNEDSDLDIAVISTNKEKRIIEQIIYYRSAISNIVESALNLIVYRESKTGMTMETKIFRDGIKLYG